jgi:hypothetical protein
MSDLEDMLIRLLVMLFSVWALGFDLYNGSKDSGF